MLNIILNILIAFFCFQKNDFSSCFIIISINILLATQFQGIHQKYTINCVIAERPDTTDILAMVRSIHIKSINK